MASENGKSVVLTVLSIIGFLAILIIGIWGAINAVRLAPQIFGNFSFPFGFTDKTIEITVPSSQLNHDTPFEISWEHNDRGDGNYAFSYRCRPSFSFSALQSDGTFSPIACESPFTIPQAQKMIRLLPSSPASRFVEVPFVIAFVDSEGEITGDGAETVTIVNESVGENGETTGSSGSGTPTTPTVRPSTSTKADLAGRVLGIGVIHSTTHTFVHQNHFGSSDTVALRFEIRNAGTKATGPWAFIAQLPTVPNFTYTSERQPSLAPGDRIEYTLQFDQIRRGSSTFTLQIDPSNEVSESSESNNIITQGIIAN